MAHWLLPATDVPQCYQQRPNKKLQANKSDLSILRKQVKGSGEQVVFSSVLKVLERSEELHFIITINSAINSDNSIFFLWIFIGVTFIGEKF